MRAITSYIPCLLLAGTLALGGCSKDDTDPGPLSAATMNDVSYGTHPQQKMDIHLPASRNGQTPLVVFVHGGGFVAGDKSEVNEAVQLYLARGYAVVNLNYRLVDSTGLLQDPVLHQPSAVKIADQLHDIRSAIDEIALRAPEWQISNNRWMLAGHSAGATLALLYTHGTHNSARQIKAAANFAGAVTFSYSDESEVLLQPPAIIEVLYRATGYEATNANKLAYMAISPYWVSNNTANGVPVINVRPSADSGHELYVNYAQMLSNKGIVNQYTVIEGAGHGFDPQGKWEEAISVSHTFFSDHAW